MLEKITRERAWLYLYRCQSDVLCDPKTAVEQTDVVYAAFLDRFGKEKPPAKTGGGPT